MTETKIKGKIGPVSASAAAGAGVSGAAAIVLVWVLGMFNVEVTAEVAGAFATLIGALGALVGGKLVPPKDGRTWSARAE